MTGVLFCIWSCKESEPASAPPIEAYNLVISGDGQIGGHVNEKMFVLSLRMKWSNLANFAKGDLTNDSE